MALAKMETKLMLLIWLASQCSKYTTFAQDCNQAVCIPVMKGKMCLGNDLQSCCPAECTFKQLGSARATYDILDININSDDACSALLTSVPAVGSLTVRVRASPIGNTCLVYGTCLVHNCVNILQQESQHVFINDDYFGTVQTVTTSQSLSPPFSTHSPSIKLTSTQFPVQSSPSAQQTSTHLLVFVPPLTSSVSHGQSMLVDKPLTATVYSNKTTTISSSQLPPPLASNSFWNRQVYAILGGVSAVGLLCAIFIVLAITYLVLLRRRGARIRDKSRVVESDNNNHTQGSRRVQQTSADGHHLEALPVTNNVHMSAQPIAASLQQKLIFEGYSNPSSSFQQDRADKFTGSDSDGGQTFFVSTNSISKPDRTAEVTMAHPVTSRPSLLNFPPYEDVDLDRGKEEASLEQSQEGPKVPQKRLLSRKHKYPKKTMHADEDVGNVPFPPNSCYRDFHVITGSERIFQETNKAYLSNLSCEQVLQLLDRLGLHVYKPVFQQGRIAGDLLVKFDDHILKKELGIWSQPHRLQLMKLITGQYSAEELLSQSIANGHDLCKVQQL